MQCDDSARRYQIMLPEGWSDCSAECQFVAGYVQTRPVAIFKSRPGSLPNLTIQTYDVSRYPSIRGPMDYVRLAHSNKRGTELRAPVQFSHGGLTGVRWEYAYNSGFMVVHSVTDYYLDGRTMVIVSSVSLPEQFSQDQQEIIPVLDSFRFTSNAVSGGALVSRN